MNSARISVAMAAYNGQKYLLPQLESLAKQKHLPFELIVCDDGSIDSTLDVIKAFAETAPFPVRIEINDHNLGYSDNFFKAAKLCSGDWIAFCDQDDVWLETKLEEVAKAISHNEKASLVLQNATICNSDLSVRGRLFPASVSAGSHGVASQYGFWVWPGFLKTIRASIIREIPCVDRPPSYFPADNVQTHDKWTCMIANALGGIVVLDGPVALYRRHEKALTGEYVQQTFSGQVSKASATGAAHYRYLSVVARETSLYLLRLSDDIVREDWAVSIKKSGYAFQDISDIQSVRAELYGATSFWVKLRSFNWLIKNRGFFGSAFCSMGWRSALKDLAFVFGIVRNSSKGKP